MSCSKGMASCDERGKPPKRTWQKTFNSFLACIILLALLGANKSTGLAQAGSAYNLIAAVNQLRAANGLPPYQTNSVLMAIAQAHSGYQASIGSITHTGKGGTRPKDRAIAAGYGGGATVYVSENIAGGTSLNTQSVVQMWQGDSLHLNTMLGANYQDVGAGVASSGNMTYYTLDAGYIAGNPGSSTSPASGSGAPVAPGPTTAIAFFQVLVATPQPDGSIVHVVQPGQSLWSIAATYKIELPELLELNGLTNNSFIFPGNELIIKPPAVALNDPTTETEATQTTTAVKKPTRTLTPKAPDTEARRDPTRTSTPTIPGESPRAGSASQEIDPLLLLIAILVFGGTALILIGNLLKRSG